MEKNSKKIVGVIPARFQSTRFPGKLLAPINGTSLLQRTYKNASGFSELADVWILADDNRILEHAKNFTENVLLTPECPTGTDRVAYAVNQFWQMQQFDIFCIIQGDEPCLSALAVKGVIKALKDDPSAGMATAAAPFTSKEEWLKPSNVKCVFDKTGNALYFSRSPIPHNQLGHKHLGIYAYRKDVLLNYAKMPASLLQQAEDLEQLKLLENGYRIKVALVKENSCGPHVDLPEDILTVEQFLCAR